MKGMMIIPAALGGFLIGRMFSETKPKIHRSPLPGVDIGPWEEFVLVMASSPKNHISPRYRLGAFQMDARRLSDVGFMREPRKGIYDGTNGVWLGEFSAPLTERRFLESMPLQYAAFVRSMQTAAPKVSGCVGKVVDGVRCSLSGLLSVSHAAGENGLSSWVDGERRFPNTTETFRRANSIF